MIHQKERCHARAEDEEHLEEKAQPVIPDGISKRRGRIAGTAHQNTDHQNCKQATGLSTSRDCGGVPLSKKVHNQQGHTEDQDQGFREDERKATEVNIYATPSNCRMWFTPYCTMGTINIGNKPMPTINRQRVVIATLSNTVTSVI